MKCSPPVSGSQESALKKRESALNFYDIMSAKEGLGWAVFIAIQYALQPTLFRLCVEQGTPPSSLVVGSEVFKMVMIIVVLALDGSGMQAWKEWTLFDSLRTAGLPSATFVIQNYCIAVAYQSLDGVMFNVLNQAKIPFTALFAFLLVGKPQSKMQCVALMMVTVAGVLISLPSDNSGGGRADTNTPTGMFYVLLGSALSGFGNAAVEWALQKASRSSLVLTLEMSVLGCIVVFCGLLLGSTEESQIVWSEGLFTRWRPMTIIPIITQGFGGMAVGFMLKVAGGVKKGFAIICGLMLTCFVQLFTHGSLKMSVLISVPLVAGGIFLHVSYPVAKQDSKAKQR